MSTANNHLSFDDFIFIDNFLEKIDNTGSGYKFLLKNALSKGLPHKFDLPYIGISDEKPTNDKLFDGFLGKYFHGTNLQIKREGRIVLYYKNIEETAFRFALEEKLDFRLAYGLIFKVVLAHELSHWIFHYCPVCCGTAEAINSMYDKVSDELHEYIAQKITRKVFEINPLFETTFNWLLKNQKEPYTIDIEEDINKIACFKSYLESKEVDISGGDFPWGTGKIEYEWFKELLFKKRGQITGKIFGL